MMKFLQKTLTLILATLIGVMCVILYVQWQVLQISSTYISCTPSGADV